MWCGRKICLSFYLKGWCGKRSWRLNKNCHVLTPTLMAISVSFPLSRAAQPEALGLSSLLIAGFLYHILSPTGLQAHWTSRGLLLPVGGFLFHIFSLTHLISNSLTSFSHRVIVQSPTQSLEWHVWSSSSGNNCRAVHRSLSSGTSVYASTMGFYLVPYCQPSPPTRFLLITAIGMCHFLPGHHFGMACLAGPKVNIQHFAMRSLGWIYNGKSLPLHQRKQFGYSD